MAYTTDRESVARLPIPEIPPKPPDVVVQRSGAVGVLNWAEVYGWIEPPQLRTLEIGG